MSYDIQLKDPVTEETAEVPGHGCKRDKTIISASVFGENET